MKKAVQYIIYLGFFITIFTDIQILSLTQTPKHTFYTLSSTQHTLHLQMAPDTTVASNSPLYIKVSFYNRVYKDQVPGGGPLLTTYTHSAHTDQTLFTHTHTQIYNAPVEDENGSQIISTSSDARGTHATTIRDSQLV